MGAKHTSTLIPLCHNIALSKVHVALELEPTACAVDITASATTVGPTGVEMEALTAAAVAALCVYDMCKAASKGIVITDLRLLAKAGGRSGDWRHEGA
jgi:cyclic pyranopterin phosphate synthase